MRLSAEIIRQQIEAVKLALPDVFEDDEWALSIESETDLTEYLRMIERKREDAAGLTTAVGMTIDDLQARKARFQRREQAMRHLLFTAMQWADLRKCELAEATLSVRDGVPRVVIVDESQIPDEFVRVKREPDKA